jgi:hypothetical protein
MNVTAKRVNAAVAADDLGEFEIILSDGSLDRDGEIVSPKSWKLPLPDRIHMNVEHGSSVSDIVGSGTPWIDELGNLKVKGTFASTPEAQHIRTLVAEGHAQFVSVEFLRGAKGVNELIGGAFTAVPANPNARILSAKSFNDQLEQVIKAASAGADVSAIVRAIHDAATHIDNTVCPAMGYADPDNDGDNDVDPGDDPDLDGVDGESSGANSKALALALRLKMLSRA